MSQNPSPVAVEFVAVSKSFLKVRDTYEAVLSTRFVSWLFGLFPFLRSFLERDSVLQEWSFSVPRGSVYGLLGKNGKGKTTAVNIIAGLLKADVGEVLLHGRNASDMSLAERGRVVSKCNHRSLLQAFDCRQNFQFVARLHSLNVADALAKGELLLELLGVSSEDMAKRVERLSLGNKAKVALVCSLLPVLRTSAEVYPILLLDEPTLGFDPFAMQSFFEALRAMRRAVPNLTIVVATNDQREVALCDSYAIVNQDHGVQDESLLAQLKEADRHCEAARVLHMRILGVGPEPKAIPSVSLGELSLQFFERPTGFAAVWWRAAIDAWTYPGMALLVVVSMIVPNLLALFAAADGNGAWRALLATSISIYSSLLIRENMRFVDRERNWFGTIETVLLAPMSRLRHLLASATFGWVMQTGYLVATIVGLLALLYPQLAAEMTVSVSQLTLGNGAGVLGVVAMISTYALGFGLLIALIPFCMRPVTGYFLMNFLPLISVLCSTIFTTPEKLPGFMQYLVQLNPLSYGAYSLNQFFAIDPGYQLPLVELVCSASGFTPAWSSLICGGSLSMLCLLCGAIWHWKVEPHLLGLGRMRAA